MNWNSETLSTRSYLGARLGLQGSPLSCRRRVLVTTLEAVCAIDLLWGTGSLFGGTRKTSEDIQGLIPAWTGLYRRVIVAEGVDLC